MSINRALVKTENRSFSKSGLVFGSRRKRAEDATRCSMVGLYNNSAKNIYISALQILSAGVSTYLGVVANYSAFKTAMMSAGTPVEDTAGVACFNAGITDTGGIMMFDALTAKTTDELEASTATMFAKLLGSSQVNVSEYKLDYPICLPQNAALFAASSQINLALEMNLIFHHE